MKQKYFKGGSYHDQILYKTIRRNVSHGEIIGQENRVY